jgi:hypothetical protein
LSKNDPVTKGRFHGKLKSVLEYRDTLYGNYTFEYDSLSLKLKRVRNFNELYIDLKDINNNKIEVKYSLKEMFSGTNYTKTVYAYIESNKIRRFTQLDTISTTENDIMYIDYDSVYIDSIYTSGIYPVVADISYSDYSFEEQNCTHLLASYTTYSVGGGGTSHVDTVHYTYSTIPFSKYIPYQMSPFHFLNGFDALDPSFILGINDIYSNSPNKNLIQRFQSVYFLSNDSYSISYQVNSLNQVIKMDIGSISYVFEYFE